MGIAPIITTSAAVGRDRLRMVTPAQFTSPGPRVPRSAPRLAVRVAAPDRAYPGARAHLQVKICGPLFSSQEF